MTGAARQSLVHCYVEAGLSIVPVLPDGSKKPPFTWKSYQQQPAPLQQVDQWFPLNGNRPPYGIAVICGSVSGNLEIIDADDFTTGLAFWADIDAARPELAQKLVIIETPRPGLQFGYRAPSTPLGNTKLALHLTGKTLPNGQPEIKALIETRGEGGYVLTVGSPAVCHPSGREYSYRQNDWLNLAVLTEEEHDYLWTLARSFNAYVAPEMQVRSPRVAPPSHGGEKRPGDEFNERESITDWLVRWGWTWTADRGQGSLWRRPGKDRDHSASLGIVAPGVFNVFSSSAYPLEMGKSYDAFGLFAHYEFHGDWEAATRGAVALGYGTPAKARRKDPFADPEPERLEATEAGEAIKPEEPRFEFLTDTALLAKPPPKYAIENLIQEKEITAIHGLSGQGKTFFALDMAMTTRRGGEWHGRPVQQGNVLYVNADGGAGYRDRVDAWLQANGPGGLGWGRHLDCEVNLFDARSVHAFIEAVRSMNEAIATIYFDTLSQCAVGADEISTKDQGLLVASLKTVRRKIDCGVTVVHHSTKDGQSMRGVATLFNACATVIRVEKEGDVISIHCNKQRNGRDFKSIYLELMPVGPSCILVSPQKAKEHRQDPKALALAKLEHIIARAELRCQEYRDERHRADTAHIRERTPEISEGSFRNYLTELKEAGSVHTWNRPGAQGNRRAVWGILCDSEEKSRLFSKIETLDLGTE